MIDDAVTETPVSEAAMTEMATEVSASKETAEEVAVTMEEEPVKTFISIDEFINKHKKYVPTA